MLLVELVKVSEAVTATRARSEKTRLLAEVLSELTPEEAPAAVSYLAGRPLHSPLGVGDSAVYRVEADPASEPKLHVLDVDRVLHEISATSGPGSQGAKHDLLVDLLSRATTGEQDFLRGMMLRNLRQGALEGVMADAVANAVEVPADLVRRAAMLEGDLIGVSARALSEGPDSLADAMMKVFTPVQPMLAKAAESVSEAISDLGQVVVEEKLDGLRVQVHRRGPQVRVYSRNLRDITDDMGPVVESVAALDLESVILDGEGLLIGPDGRSMSFQDSMSGRAESSPERFSAFFFDMLHLNGTDLLDLSLTERRSALAEVVPRPLLVGAIETADPETGEAFFERAVADGFEGVVVKTPDQPYAAGRRGSGWLKVKPTHTLDLLILAAEWGSGRRQGWLSNLHLGALGPDGDYVMLGKTFKGLTDEMLAWQTEAFLEIEDHRKGRAVFIEPKIVYEIAFDGVQRSTRYPGGVALRFARVKGYRDDKDPGDIDTLETVRSYLR